MTKEKVLQNRYGCIPVGTKVWFSVENQNCWKGPTKGILKHDGKDFFVQTSAGDITINKGWDIYLNTIEPIKE